MRLRYIYQTDNNLFYRKENTCRNIRHYIREIYASLYPRNHTSSWKLTRQTIRHFICEANIHNIQETHTPLHPGSVLECIVVT